MLGVSDDIPGLTAPPASIDTHSKILGVAKGASSDELKKAYKKLALKVRLIARCDAASFSGSS